MIHVLYQTVNLKNDKFYVGVHSTEDFLFGTPKATDRYIGSGPRLRSALKSYGRKNFIVQAIKCFDTAEEAYAAEGKIVTEEFVKDPNHYNLTPGGNMPPRGNPPPPPQPGNKHAVGHEPWNKGQSNTGIVGNRNAHLNGTKTRYGKGHKPWNAGKVTPEETRQKIRETLRNRNKSC